jgi:hypothetical protein
MDSLSERPTKAGDWADARKRLVALKDEGFTSIEAAKLAYPLVRRKYFYETWIYKDLVDKIFD